MDKRKLIGTIIGVTLFAALIAGATFAWLTFAVNVTNGTYTANTMEFKITYTKGNDLNDPENPVPIVGVGNKTTAIGTGLSAYRTANSPDGLMYFKMSTETNNLLTTSGVLKYAVCLGTASAGSCTADFTTANVATDANLLAVGSVDIDGITANTDGEYTVTLHSLSTIPTAQTYYWVYYWMDGATYNNDMVGLEFDGYIHASAEQR